MIGIKVIKAVKLIRDIRRLLRSLALSWTIVAPACSLLHSFDRQVGPGGRQVLRSMLYFQPGPPHLQLEEGAGLEAKRRRV